MSTLATGLDERSLGLTPMCTKCGWRMGGLDSWDGTRCRCGLTSANFAHLLGSRCWCGALLVQGECSEHGRAT